MDSSRPIPRTCEDLFQEENPSQDEDLFQEDPSQEEDPHQEIKTNLINEEPPIILVASVSSTALSI